MGSEDQKGGQSGGVNVSGGNLNAGGDVVGRDKITTGASGTDLDRLFQPILEAIKQSPPPEQTAGISKLEALKEEVAKGKKADDSLIAKHLDGLATIPNVAKAILTSFSGPVLSAMAGPVTQFVLGKLIGQ